MKLQGDNLCFLIFLSSSLLLNGAIAFTVNNITCSGSTLLDFRIEGCNEQPCTIRRGKPLPFEIDLSFERPEELADDVYFNVFLPKYALPPATKGSSLLTATCDKGNLGFSCPIKAGLQHTLKSSLFIDSLARCTGDCQFLGENGTGLRKTKWRWTISDRKQKASRKSNGGNRGKHTCTPTRQTLIVRFRLFSTL